MSAQKLTLWSIWKMLGKPELWQTTNTWEFTKDELERKDGLCRVYADVPICFRGTGWHDIHELYRFSLLGFLLLYPLIAYRAKRLLADVRAREKAK